MEATLHSPCFTEVAGEVGHSGYQSIQFRFGVDEPAALTKVLGALSKHLFGREGEKAGGSYDRKTKACANAACRSLASGQKWNLTRVSFALSNSIFESLMSELAQHPLHCCQS